MTVNFNYFILWSLIILTDVLLCWRGWSIISQPVVDWVEITLLVINTVVVTTILIWSIIDYSKVNKKG